MKDKQHYKTQKTTLELTDKEHYKVYIGLNWGMKKREGLMKIFGQASVDLDASLTMFSQKQEIDTVYFKKLKSDDGSVTHSGDDTDGNINGIDEQDNEVIQIELNKVNDKVDSIWIYLTSYKKQNFADIPFTKIRVYNYTKAEETNELASFDLSTKPEFNDCISMLMGKLERNEKGWTFKSLGQAIGATDIPETIAYIQQELL